MKAEDEDQGPISAVNIGPDGDILIKTETHEKFHATLSQFAFGSNTSLSTIGLRRSPRKFVSPSRMLDSPAYSPRKAKDGTTAWDKTASSRPKKREAVDDVDDGVPTGGNSPTKRQKQKRGFADPTKYAHLQNLNDYLKEDLHIVFCGINPGVKSAEIGHHFGNPTNQFWACLHESGLSSERLRPEEDYTLPKRFNIGMTNLVDRPTAEQNELSKAEQIASVPTFLHKIARYRPQIVCFVGMGIGNVVATQVLRDLKIKGGDVNNLGLQPYKLIHLAQPGDTNSTARETMFYALSSTSGRVVQYTKKDKIKMFKDLKNTAEKIKESKLDTSKLHVVKLPIITAEEGSSSSLSGFDGAHYELEPDDVVLPKVESDTSKLHIEHESRV